MTLCGKLQLHFSEPITISVMEAGDGG